MQDRINPHAYWEGRQDLLYYQVVRQLVEGFGGDIRSMLDVGSKACPYLDWFPRIQTRVSLDLVEPYAGPRIEAVKADFLHWEPTQTFDLVTCLQVLEHVPRPDLFARKLLAVGKIVIVSVPFDWKPDSVADHLHDPITERDMRRWFGREANFTYVCREVVTRSNRLIQVYERNAAIWTNLGKRSKLHESGFAAAGDRPSTRLRLRKRMRKNNLVRTVKRNWRRLWRKPES